MKAIRKLITNVSDRLPKMNTFMLKEFPKKKMDELVESIGVILDEATTTVPGALEYKNYEILDPYKQAKFDMKIGRGSTIKPEIPTAVSEWKLVKYNFVHNSMDGRNEVSLHLYVPYITNGFVVLGGKKMVVRKGISETVFARMDEKGFHGILFRLNRVKLKFEMIEIQPLFSMRDPKVNYGHEYVTHSQIYTGKIDGRSRAKTTDFLYLLAEFGLKNTLEMFDIDPSEISFTSEIRDESDYDYFLAKHPSFPGEPIYLRVRKGFIVAKDREEEDDPQFKMQRRTVANLVYLLSRFGFQRINELYDPRGLVWKTIVGKIISPKKSDIEARADAENHFSSARGFVDPMSKERFARFGFGEITDLYSLLKYVYRNMNWIMANTVAQDLSSKRIDCIDALKVDHYSIPLNKQFYGGYGKSTLKESDVKDIFRVRPNLIESVKSSTKAAVEIIDINPQITTDNWLVSCGSVKVRHGGHAKERFHSSIAVVESQNSLCGQEAGKTGIINPFVQIDEEGKILMPKWTKELDPIKSYLPHN